MKLRRNKGALLPDSLLLEIFNYLPYADLCKASRVCKRWRRVSQDSTLRRRIDLRSTPLTLAKLKKFICSQCTKVLQTFQIQGSGVFIDHGKPCKDMVQFTPSCFKDLESRSPNLKYLSIEKSFIAKDKGLMKEKEFHIPESLTHFSLRGCFIHPSSSIHFSQDIECLDLGSTSIDSTKRLLKLSHINRLKALYLDYCSRITDDHIFMLMTLLRRLTVLDLEHTRITNESISVVLYHCKELTHLYIGHNHVSHEPFLKKDKGKIKNLMELCLLETHFDMAKEQQVRKRVPNLTMFAVSRVSGEHRKSCEHYKKHTCEMIKSSN